MTLLLSLHQLLSAKKADLMSRWTERVRKNFGPARDTETIELLDHLPIFLDELIAALAEHHGLPGSSPLPESSPAAAEHGQQRLRLGFKVEQVVREYGILRDCILELIEESGTAVAVSEFRVLSTSVNTGTAEAVARYVKDRDEELRAQVSQHFGFLAHELRNKLSAARYALAALRQRELSQSNKRVEVLEGNLASLGSMIDQALRQLRERASFDLRLTPVHLTALLQQICEELSLEAEQRNVELVTEGEVPAIEADAALLGSAISNLVANALKFSRSGSTVSVRTVQHNGSVWIEVEDTCGGLPDSVLEKLFNPYIQLGVDRSGFGLGLAIAKQAAEAHGGRIEAESLPGKGCVFRLALPKRPPADP